MTIAVYQLELLPSNFSYPAEYLALTSGPSSELYPWWLIDAGSKAGQLMYRTTIGAGKLLVPFAKTDLFDDIACFNAAVPSSNSEIVMICSAPERAYGFADFATWHAQATKDAACLSPAST